MDPLGLTFRVLHILCGVFWAGAGMMLAGFVVPVIEALGPDGGKFMQRMMGPARFAPFMTGAAILTAATGILMLRLQETGLATWWASNYGRSILVGAVAGLAAFVLGLAVNAPTSKRLARIAHELQTAGAPPGEGQLQELAALRGRLRTAGRVAGILMLVSVVAMAAAAQLS